MKAISLQQPGKFELINVAEPGRPGPGEAVVRVHNVGICGTDTSAFLGKMPLFQYPRIPGHELGVEVLEVGEGVTNVKSGDRCSVEPYMNCQRCIACRRGHGNCCENLKVLGVMSDGGLRQSFTLPAHKLHAATSLNFEQLALVETLAIGCHAVDRATPTEDDTILVIGAGPIGLSAMIFARLTSCRTLVLDMNAERLEFAMRTMGVDAIIQTAPTAEETAAALRKAGGGDLPTVVIDATGSYRSMSEAFHYLAPTGKLVYVGITSGEVTFRHPTLHRPEGTILASRNALPRDFTRIISLIEQGQINTGPWITHRCDFDDLIDNFPSYTKPETGVIKAVVQFS